MKAFLQSVTRLYTLPTWLVLSALIISTILFNPELEWSMKVLSEESDKYRVNPYYYDTVATGLQETPYLGLSLWLKNYREEEDCVIDIQQEVSYVQTRLLLEKQWIEQAANYVRSFSSFIFFLSLIYVPGNIIYALAQKGFSISTESFFAFVSNLLILLVFIGILMISGPIVPFTGCLPSQEVCHQVIDNCTFGLFGSDTDAIVKVTAQAELIGIDYIELPKLALGFALSSAALILMFFRVYFLFWNKPKPDLNSNN